MSEHDKMAQEIVELIEGQSPTAHPTAARIRKLRNDMAVEFGNRFGLSLSGSISPQQLSRKGIFRKPSEFDYERRYWDHPYSYKKDGHAAMVAVHLYDYNRDSKSFMKGLVSFCFKYKLNCNVLEDLPSWHYPGHTTLVVYMPMDSAIMFRESEQ